MTVIEGTLLLAVPTTRREFRCDVVRRSDFLVHGLGFDGDEQVAWMRYQPYATLCAELIEYVERRGVRVLRSATLADLARAVARPGVTTRVAHAPGGCLEFADGLWDYSEIDRALPVAMADTLDLTVCRSVGLAEILRRRRSTGIILANGDSTPLSFRLALYRQAVTVAAERGVSYVDAALTLREHLRSGKVLWRH